MEIYIVKQDILNPPGSMYEDVLDIDLGAYPSFEDAVKAIKKYDPLGFGPRSKMYSVYESANGFTKIGYSRKPSFCVTVYVNREPLPFNEQIEYSYNCLKG